MKGTIYLPEEDSYFLNEFLIEKMNHWKNSLKILEVGCGSGIQLDLFKEKGFENVLGIDLNKDSVNYCLNKGHEVIESNLFEKIRDKFDLIIFNPPYLPEDKLEPETSRLATTGGIKGSELINRFLEEGVNYLKEDGKIILLYSSLTEGIDFRELKVEEKVEKNLFFERLIIVVLKKK